MAAGQETISGARGFQVMNLIVVDRKGVPLGLCGQAWWTRTETAVTKSNKSRSTEEKETKHPYSEPEDLLALVKDHTGTGTWSDEGISASTLRGWLVVRQYPEVQEESAALIAMVRAAR